MHCILFGNPAVLKLRTRSFASPDYSGFALSEIMTVFLQFLIWDCNSVNQSRYKFHNNHKKSAHFIAEVSAFQVIITKGLKKDSESSSATRLSLN